MKTKYIIVIALIVVYFLIISADKKAAGEEYFIYEAGLAEGMLMGGSGAAGEATSRKKKSTEGAFKSTTNILFNGWTILAIVGIAIYMMGGFNAILNNPMLMVFGVLIFGVMAIMK